MENTLPVDPAGHPYQQRASTGSDCGIGWSFYRKDPSGAYQQMHPTITGEMSFDVSRDVRRAISGQILLAADLEKFDLTRDEFFAFLVVGETEYAMGVFRASEITIQPDAIINTDEPDVLGEASDEVSDLVFVSWADRMIRLRSNDGSPETVYEGADPAQEMIRLLTEAQIPHSVAGSVDTTRHAITWDGSATLYSKIEELAELAGHRPPWPNNSGILISIESGLVPTDAIPLLDLGVVDGTLIITENYLSAPNRVIVTDSSGTSIPIRGEWNAPASAPHSEARRGWMQTEMVSLQGVNTGDHANLIAQTIGENFTARTLTCDLADPTYLLDGPVVLSYDNAFWLLQNWSVGLAPSSPMRVSMIELLAKEVREDIGRSRA